MCSLIWLFSVSGGLRIELATSAVLEENFRLREILKVWRTMRRLSVRSPDRLVAGERSVFIAMRPTLRWAIFGAVSRQRRVRSATDKSLPRLLRPRVRRPNRAASVAGELFFRKKVLLTAQGLGV